MSPPASVNHVGTRDGSPISRTAEATTTAAAPTSRTQSAGFERLLPPRSDMPHPVTIERRVVEPVTESESRPVRAAVTIRWLAVLVAGAGS